MDMLPVSIPLLCCSAHETSCYLTGEAVIQLQVWRKKEGKIKKTQTEL